MRRFGGAEVPPPWGGLGVQDPPPEPPGEDGSIGNAHPPTPLPAPQRGFGVHSPPLWCSQPHSKAWGVKGGGIWGHPAPHHSCRSPVLAPGARLAAATPLPHRLSHGPADPFSHFLANIYHGLCSNGAPPGRPPAFEPSPLTPYGTAAPSPTPRAPCGSAPKPPRGGCGVPVAAPRYRAAAPRAPVWGFYLFFWGGYGQGMGAGGAFGLEASAAMAGPAPRTVLVTGCSSGIGLAVAVRLAQDPQRRFQGEEGDPRP
ncbi:Retinol dehydrogenase 8 [Aix galericulata]|nr:Retinol dehydrogenase 8 [Aix galericulata]